MKPYSRAERVGGLIRRVLSDLLLKEIKDPRLKGSVITDVRMTRDLKIARVYFSLSGTEAEIADALAGFQSAKGYVKRLLSSELKLRYLPEITFFYDQSFDYGARIDAVLKSVIQDDESDPSANSET